MNSITNTSSLLWLNDLAASSVQELLKLNMFAEAQRKHSTQIDLYAGIVEEFKAFFDSYDPSKKATLPDIDKLLAPLAQLSEELELLQITLERLSQYRNHTETANAAEKAEQHILYCHRLMRTAEISTSISNTQKLNRLLLLLEEKDIKYEKKNIAYEILNSCTCIKSFPPYYDETVALIESFDGDEAKLNKNVKKHIDDIEEFAKIHKSLEQKIDSIKDYYPRKGKEEAVSDLKRLNEILPLLQYNNIKNFIQVSEKIEAYTDYVIDQFQLEKERFKRVIGPMFKKDRRIFEKEHERLLKNSEYENYSYHHQFHREFYASTKCELLIHFMIFILGASLLFLLYRLAITHNYLIFKISFISLFMICPLYIIWVWINIIRDFIDERKYLKNKQYIYDDKESNRDYNIRNIEIENELSLLGNSTGKK